MSDFRSNNILRRQRMLFYIVLGVVLVLCVVVFYVMMSHEGGQNIAQIAPKIDLPGDKINPQEMAITRIDGSNKFFEKKMEFFEQTLLELKKSEENKVIEIAKLKEELKNIALTANPVSPLKTVEDIPKKQLLLSALDQTKTALKENLFDPMDDPFVNAVKKTEKAMPPKPVFQEMVMGKARRSVFHVDKAIPSGTSVKALLVSSIDATCGTYSKSDPQPVKLRIIDNGHLPKEVEAKIKGGIIIASAYGDISTERVYMRLERLTMVEQNGDFIETSVTGFVSGNDGKFGVRGSVVDKSEKIVANAARSGFFSGIGGILQSAVSRHDVNQMSLDIVKQGGASGAASAFDMLSEYYIQRAEQVMPVIQVAAGQIVDITFTYKAELGDIHTKEKVREIREDSRRSKQS